MVRTEIDRLNLLYAVFNGAKALVSIFGPIYLLQSGFSLQAVLLYCIMTAVVKCASLWPVFWLASRVGARVTMSAGVCVMALHFVWFAQLIKSDLWLAGLALLLGMANALFYPSFRLLFSFAARTSNITKHVARQNISMIVAMTGAPIIGGVIATTYGIQYTYGSAALLFLIVAIYSLHTRHQAQTFRFVTRRIPRGAALRDYVANASYSFSGLADLAVWPLYVALIIPTYAGIGAYAGVVALIAILVQAIVGRFETVRSERRLLTGGVVLNSIYNAGRIIATTTPQLLGLSVINALGGAMLAGAYGSRFYKNIHPEQHAEYLFAMECANSVTWLVYFPILLVVSMAADYETTLRLGVLLVVPAVFGMWGMRVFAVSSGR